MKTLNTILTIILLMTTHSLQAKELAPRLYKDKLANGLTVIGKEIPDAKVATVQIWVKAGSIYEDADEGGITHLIEHMIFKGTPTRGPGELAQVIEGLGGRINAYTSFEYTVYHATLSARHWSTALDILADSVLHSSFDPDELEREKKVVLEELSMRNDRASSKLFQELMTNSFQNHPYRLPVIGTEESITGFSRQDILAYMARHYHPDNITIVAVGNIRFHQLLAQSEKLFSHLTPADTGKPDLPREPVQTKARLFSLEEDIGQTHLALALPITPFDHPDTPVLDVISAILGQGETSRLYHRLRNEQQLVYRINCSAFTPRYPGLMEISATLEAEDISAALESILTEIYKLKYLEVSDRELTRVKRNLESDFIFNLEQVEGQARILGSFEFISGDPREDSYLERIREVNREDILRVANKYFLPTALTAGSLVPRQQSLTLNEDDLGQLINRAEAKARQQVPESLVRPSYLHNVHRFRLKNGITLLVREDNEIPTTAIRAIFPGGLRSETPKTNGVFAFISELLPTGTDKLSATELAAEIADMAGSIHGFNGKNTFGLKADFLSRFLEPGLSLVRDIILTPAFSQEEAEKIRPELLAQLKLQEDNLPVLAFREFNQALFADHPYGLNTAGRPESLSTIPVSDLQKIYRQHARPENLVLVISGDVKAKQVRQLVETSFNNWPASPPLAEEKKKILPPVPPAEPERINLDRDKNQTHIIIGFLGTGITGKDRFPLEVLETILSGQSGRLFTELRDRDSLAYSLSAFSLFGLDTGSFGVYIGTSPNKKKAVIAALWQQLTRLQQEEVDPAELKRAQNLLISHYEMGLQSHGAQAMEIGLNETYGLSQNYGNDYEKAIMAISPADIMAAARKFIQPDHHIMVTVGAHNNQDRNKGE